MQEHVRRLVNHDRCIGVGDEATQTGGSRIVRRVDPGRLASGDEVATTPILDPTNVGMIVGVVIGEVPVSR